MTTNPIQPNKGNRDDASSRPGAAAGNQPQSGQSASAKQGQSATSRDEGSRSFRSSSDVSAAGQARTGGSSEIIRCLDSIEENISKVRAALSASDREGTSQSADRQSSDRQGSPSGSRSSRDDSNESSSDRNRDVTNRL